MNAVCPGSEACGSVFCRQWPENIVPDGELVGAKFGRLPEKSLSLPIRGEVLEWLKRRAWKARIRLKRIRGSNPLLSATNAELYFRFSVIFLTCFFLIKGVVFHIYNCIVWQDLLSTDLQ